MRKTNAQLAVHHVLSSPDSPLLQAFGADPLPSEHDMRAFIETQQQFRGANYEFLGSQSLVA